MNYRSSLLFASFVSVLLASGHAPSSAQPGFAQQAASSVEDTGPVIRQTLQACRVAATTGTLLGALPAAWLGDELAIRAVVNGVAALEYSNATFASPVPLPSSIARSTEVFANRKDVILKVAHALQLMRQQSSQVLKVAQDAVSAEILENAAPTRISAANGMAMLSQRLGKSAAELVTINGLNPDAVFLLGKDTKNFQELLDAMIDGKSELRIKPARTSATKQALAAISKSFTPMKEQAQVVLENLRGLVEAREAHARLQSDLYALGSVARIACQK
jgi:hypothetical protein